MKQDADAANATMPHMQAEFSSVIKVDLPGHAYDVTVRPGMLDELGSLLPPAARKTVVITDSNVGPRHAAAVEQALRAAGRSVVIATIPAGEEHKTVQTIASLYDQILPSGIDRSTLVLALGGGVIGDMAGFVAATLLRGIPYMQVPTSLLAMVDASVGGKTGVNHAVGKNLIGAFHQPIAVAIDPRALATLRARELRGGLAECIKHDIIRDADGFAALEVNISRALAGDVNYLAGLIAHNVAIKAKVVAADPFENGERAHLNFGHTFGHAIENVSHYSYSHGESVALGMVAAARLAVDLGLLDERSRERIVAVIAQAGLPVSGMRLNTTEVVEAMIYDKKVKAGRVRFVLPDRIGHVVIRDDVPTERVARAVESLEAGKEFVEGVEDLTPEERSGAEGVLEPVVKPSVEPVSRSE